MPRPKLSPKSESEIMAKAALVTESLIEDNKEGMIYAGDINSYTVVECSEWSKAEQAKVKRTVRNILKEKNKKITNKPTEKNENTENCEEQYTDYETTDWTRTTIRQYQSFARMSDQQAKECFELYCNAKVNGDISSAKTYINRLVKAHLYIAAHHVQKYPFESQRELLQDAYILVYKSVQAYEPTKGTSIATFISLRVANKLKDYAYKPYYATIKTPAYVDNEKRKIEKYRNTFYVTYGTYPASEDIIEHFGYTKEQYDLYRSAIQISCVPLNMDINDDTTEISEIISDEYDLTSDAEQHNLEEIIANVLCETGIDSRTLMIIKLHNGLIDGTRYSFNQIGKLIAPYNIKHGKPKTLSGESCRLEYLRAITKLGSDPDILKLKSILCND
ncbi:MAG: hypothetical protein K6F27_10840 [Ruminococcus sp.]|nr:hypothetical protein [Ruminococcus sp.]